MRLTKAQEQRATAELVEMLTANPAGLATSDMVGTKSFHGERSLSAKQVARLLRAANTKEYCGGQGMRTFTILKLRLSERGKPHAQKRGNDGGEKTRRRST